MVTTSKYQKTPVYVSPVDMQRIADALGGKSKTVSVTLHASGIKRYPLPLTPKQKEKVKEKGSTRVTLSLISTTLHQKIYQMMMEHFAAIDETIRSELERELKKKKVSEEKIDETLEALKPTAEFFDSVAEFDVEDLDAKQKNLVLLDDVVAEKNQRDFINLYVHGRHRNISPVYLSQSF